jgi:hypothetical protein
MPNPLGFQAIDKLPTGARMNGEYFTINILARLEKIQSFQKIPGPISMCSISHRDPNLE